MENNEEKKMENNEEFTFKVGETIYKLGRIQVKHIRGVQISPFIYQGDPAPLIKLLPRITTPVISPQDVEEIELEDFLKLQKKFLLLWAGMPEIEGASTPTK